MAACRKRRKINDGHGKSYVAQFYECQCAQWDKTNTIARVSIYSIAENSAAFEKYFNLQACMLLQMLHRIIDLKIVAFGLSSVEDLNRELATWHHHQWRIVEVFLELAGIQRCTHDDNLQVATIAGNLQVTR
jgi:hypothetical protein